MVAKNACVFRLILGFIGLPGSAMVASSFEVPDGIGRREDVDARGLLVEGVAEGVRRARRHDVAANTDVDLRVAFAMVEPRACYSQESVVILQRRSGRCVGVRNMT